MLLNPDLTEDDHVGGQDRLTQRFAPSGVGPRLDRAEHAGDKGTLPDQNRHRHPAAEAQQERYCPLITAAS